MNQFKKVTATLRLMLNDITDDITMQPFGYADANMNKNIYRLNDNICTYIKNDEYTTIQQVLNNILYIRGI